MKNIDFETIKSITEDRDVRRNVTKKSLLMFFLVYFSHYIKYELADFQKEIIDIAQNKKNKLVCITAFRGSAKSTLITTATAIWSILGSHEKKIILIISQTASLVKTHMLNIRAELEDNILLKSDLGPFKEETGGEWAVLSLVFKNTGAKIIGASMEQSIRGTRNKQNRPDLIILDDIEDSDSVKTFESRSKTFDWFTREILPIGDRETRTIVVGNLLHEDSLVVRLKNKIGNNEVEGIYREYPFLNQEGKTLWPGKFPNGELIEELRRSLLDPISWQREYLLKIVPDEYQVVHRGWIKSYDKLPDNRKTYSYVVIGIDPAISENNRADYTGIVAGLAVNENGLPKLYILPDIVNERLTFPDLVERIKAISDELYRKYCPTVIVVESVAFQEAIAQTLRSHGYINCESVHVSSDKRSRLTTLSHRIKSGEILFPKTGAEKLIQQIVGFGVERHDDIMDAFTLGANRYVSHRPILLKVTKLF
jgi:predicted phage terminase large subunit-like protein